MGEPRRRAAACAPVVVVGVLSSSFVLPEALLDGRTADVWRPVDPAHPDFEDRYSRSLIVAGRLARGATLEDACREASDLAKRRAREFPDIYVRTDGTLVDLPIALAPEALPRAAAVQLDGRVLASRWRSRSLSHRCCSISPHPMRFLPALLPSSPRP